jgi:hypothetical protein
MLAGVEVLCTEFSITALARFAVRSGRSKDLEIIVPRPQLAVL